MNKVKSFIKEFVAVVKGDDLAARAEKVLRQADSALSTQIASLEGDIVTKEDEITNAKEALVMARVNQGSLIVDRAGYVTNLINKRNAVVIAEESLKTLKEKIDFLKGERTSLSEEVDEA